MTFKNPVDYEEKTCPGCGREFGTFGTEDYCYRCLDEMKSAAMDRREGEL